MRGISLPLSLTFTLCACLGLIILIFVFASGLYHVWQVQQTWPLLFLALGFGLLMKLCKDLWVLVAFHFLVNMWLAFGVSFG
jgi:hypothetical protein